MGKAEVTRAGHPRLGPDFRDLMSRTARENALQEPDVRVTGRMSGGADVRGYWPDVRAPNPRMNSRNSILGAEIGDFGGKIAEISCMKSGEKWGKARSTSNKANPWIKINKTSSSQQIKKKWDYFWWGFSKLGKNTTKSSYKTRGRSSKYMIKVAHDTI